MKLKATKKQIKSNASELISISYCAIQTLLRYSEPFAYSSGGYGWACDYYDIDGVIISTGYSPIGDSVSHDLVKEYEGKAQKISGNYDIDYDAKKPLILELLSEFVKEATKK